MANYWKLLKKAVGEVDVVLEVIDARLPAISRNEQLEREIEKQGKKLIIVVNKCDLVGKESMDRLKKELSKIAPCVFISTKEKHGMIILKETIMKQTNERPIKIAAVGYPNVGKSSLINMFKGKQAAPVSSVAGYTRGLQWIRISKNMKMIDSPGVIPYDEHDIVRLGLLGAKNPAQMKDPETVALSLIETLKEHWPGVLEGTYGVDENVEEEDGDELLEAVGKKLGKLKKGGVVDTVSAAIVVIQDWQQGKMKQVEKGADFSRWKAGLG